MISLGGLVSQRAFGKFEMGKVISNPFANAFIKEAEGSEDHEVSMANNSLDTIIKMATELKAKMGENEKDIPAWIQDHITNAENFISQASSNYHEYGQNESVVTEGNTAFEILMLIRNLEQTNKLLAQDLKTSKRLPNDKKENIKKSIVVNQGLINYYKETYKNLKNNESVNEASPCWKGYKQVGMKDKGGRQVPNCVPNESVVNESSYTLGKVQYTDKNMTPTQILDLAMAYVQTPITKIVGNKTDFRVRAANDLAKLTGTTQADVKTRGKQPALILTLSKNGLVSKDEYIKLYKDLLAKQIHVIKYLKNSSPEMRNSSAAMRAAERDGKGEFDI